MKSGFGPEYTVTDVSLPGPSIRVLSARKLPDGLSFDPANCARAAGLPTGCRGNMAAVSAEGSSRFVVAVETSQPLPAPARERLQQVTFPRTYCGAASVSMYRIDGTQTLGVHRVLQAGRRRVSAHRRAQAIPLGSGTAR